MEHAGLCAKSKYTTTEIKITLDELKYLTVEELSNRLDKKVNAFLPPMPYAFKNHKRRCRESTACPMASAPFSASRFNR